MLFIASFNEIFIVDIYRKHTLLFCKSLMQSRTYVQYVNIILWLREWRGQLLCHNKQNLNSRKIHNTLIKAGWHHILLLHNVLILRYLSCNKGKKHDNMVVVVVFSELSVLMWKSRSQFGASQWPVGLCLVRWFLKK